MIFSSWQFIFVYLPAVLIVYFLLNKFRFVYGARLWLVAANLAFYSYWNIKHLPLLVGSILFNYYVGDFLIKNYCVPEKRDLNKWALRLGVGMNLLALGYFKYTGFVIENLNHLPGIHLAPVKILLPLGISFFTFQQIAYLVDSYSGKVQPTKLINYSMFITFFPHLIAGPLLHHSDIIKQFSGKARLVFSPRNVLLGLSMFSLGLSKKVVIADTLSKWAGIGFDGKNALDFYGAWLASLSYTFQLYFDFSGYCDMALGCALMFNITIPYNFNSPYKSLDIQDFWRRWNITLGLFLRNYIYIPLGGSRVAEVRVCANLFITFLLGGIWHGASWMFVIWGAAHGLALIVHRQWASLGIKMPKAVAWGITFLFVNLTWVFFRAGTVGDAIRVLKGLIDFRSIVDSSGFYYDLYDAARLGVVADWLYQYVPFGLIASLIGFIYILFCFYIILSSNSYEIVFNSKGLSLGRIFLYSIGFSLACYFIFSSTSAVFLYFNF